MAVVGDRVQVPGRKVGESGREGVVTAVIGSLLRVEWSSGGETIFAPAAGSLVVVAKSRQKAVGKRTAKAAPAPAKAVGASAAKKATKKAAKASDKKAGNSAKRR